jgi:hypothetical protein
MSDEMVDQDSMFEDGICGCMGELKADAAPTHWPQAEYQGSRIDNSRNMTANMFISLEH